MDEVSGLLREVARPRPRDQRPAWPRAARPRRSRPSSRSSCSSAARKLDAYGGPTTRARRGGGGAGAGRRVDRRARAAADPRRDGHDDHRRRRDRRRLRARARARDPARPRGCGPSARASGDWRCSRSPRSAAALAGSLGVLLVFRALQAAGGAAALLAAFHVLDAGESRSGRRLWLGAALVGTAAGPAIGGALTEVFDWRAIFFVQAPIAAAAALACLRRRGDPRLARRAAEPRAEATRCDARRSAEAGRLWSRPAAAVGAAPVAATPAAPTTRRASRRTARDRPLRPRRRGPRRRSSGASLVPLASLAFTAAAFTAVLFLLVIELVAGFAISPLRAALGVTVLPIAALAAAAIPGPPRPRALAGAVLLAGGAAALAFLPAAGIAWTSSRSCWPAPGMGLALPAYSGELLPERNVAEAARVLVARHVGIVVVLAILAPVATHKLEVTTERGDPAGRGARARRPDRSAAEARARARAVRGRRRRPPARRAAGRRRQRRAAVRRRRRGLRPARRAPRRRRGRRRPGRVQDRVPDRRRARPARRGAARSPPGAGPRSGSRPRVALVTRRRLRRRARRARHRPPVDARRTRATSASCPRPAASPGAIQNEALQLLDRAACQAGTSREEYALALFDPKRAAQFERTTASTRAAPAGCSHSSAARYADGCSRIVTSVALLHSGSNPIAHWLVGSRSSCSWPRSCWRSSSASSVLSRYRKCA